ncbi:hypothetical protein [Aneurinibacillus tyrosinisolvens]|nr:hypothetical protein [Aneurinibacillus tyrosinisolvens]
MGRVILPREQVILLRVSDYMVWKFCALPLVLVVKLVLVEECFVLLLLV